MQSSAIRHERGKASWILYAALAGALVLAILAGCSDGKSNNSPPAEPKARVYASGYYYDADWYQMPCYWRDGVRSPLSVMGGTSTGAAMAITASGGTVYIAGYSDMNHPVACYWVGGTRYDQAHVSEGAVGISVDSGTVYTVVNNPYLTTPEDGSTNSGMYYENQTRAENLFGENTYTKGISAINGSICAVGKNNDKRAVYWLDSSELGIIETILETSGTSDACAIYPSGNFNYIAGSIGVDSSEKPCYWAITIGKNRTDLDIGTYYGEALAIKVVDNVVYTAGWYNDGSGSGNIPCFWEGAARKALPKGSSDSQATGIDVLDGIVYISGWYRSGPIITPCYWTVAGEEINRIDLPGGANDSQATGIVVVIE